MASNDKVYLKQYYHYLKRHMGLLIASLVMIPLITLAHLVQPYLLKVGIDAHIVPQQLNGLTGIVALFGLAVATEFVFRSLQSFFFQYMGQKTLSRIREDLYEHVLSLSSSYFDRTPRGIITSRLTSDVESLNDSLASGIITLIGDVLTLIGILIFMLFLSPKLTLISLVVAPPLTIMINFFRLKLRDYYNQIRVIMGRINAMLQEQLHGVEIVQLFLREKKNIARFSQLNKDYRRATLGSVYFDALLFSMVDAMSAVVIALMIWVGFGQYLGGFVTLGILVAFIDYIQKFFQPLKELSMKFAVLQQALAALEKIFGTFEIKDKIPSGESKLASSKGHLVFENVSFSYPGFENKPVLKDISFELEPGKVVALVGPTGSGKTTIGRLMSHLYTGFKGKITLDGVDIKALDLQNLRSHISVVTQDVQLFSESIIFNIAMGDDTVTIEDVKNAARLSQATQFIEKLPNQYDTILDHRGQSLSLGQAQLISLARAIASKSPIILLDEATANVDSMSEKLIQDATEEMFKRRTVLVIAHRLSTIQKADTILAMNDGEIVESGSHSELIAKNGFYAKLFAMQFEHL